MAVAEIPFAVVIARCGGSAALGAFACFGKFGTPAGPTAVRAFDPVTDTPEQFLKGHFERQGGIEGHALFREP